MASSLSSLREEVKLRVGRRSNTALSNARIDKCIAHAIRQLASPKVHRHAELEFRATLTTADGSAPGASTDQQNGRYTIPIASSQEIWTIYSVRDTTSTNVRRILATGVQFLDEVVKTFGPPYRYARWGRTMEFDPVPKAIHTIQIRGYIYPVLVFDGNNELTGNSPLHEIYDEGVLLGAEHRLWMNVLQNPARGGMVFNQLSDWMETIISPYDGELDDMEDVLAPDLDGLLGSGR